MSWPASVGWLVFIVVPGVLWLVGAWANRGHGFAACALAFMVGSDNRLSLSRLQAFAWTLVIFGSFAAAMSIHTPIKSATAEEIKAATDTAKKAADEAAVKKAALQSVQADLATAEAASKTAQDTQVDDEAAANVLAAASKAAPDNKDLATKAQTAQAKALDAKASAEGKAAVLAQKKKIVNTAQAFYTQAEDAAKKAQNAVPNSAWVQIPAALLALAGIAIGSGVFSSLIAAAGGEGQTAGVTGLVVRQFIAVGNQPPQALPQDETILNPPRQPHSLIIQGAGLGDGGKVRFGKGGLNKEAARLIYWKTDGSEIALDVADQAQASYKKLVVDTPNGKLTYELSGQHPTLQLGHAIIHYEWADLFRDDKNPETLSLMKFQMFGWTVIAVAIYVYLLLHGNLTPETQTLPVVDPSIVTLTGVSQAGYLTGKGVSNLSSSP